MAKLFDIINIEDQADGSAILILNYGLEFADIVKKATGKKRLTKKVLENFVVSAIKEGLEGYAGNKK